MRPKTPQDVCSLLMREKWHAGIYFYEGAKDCRKLRASLIRDSLPLLRDKPLARKDVRTLVAYVNVEESDSLVEEAWQTAIDVLRALHYTSPTGTAREREKLLSFARNKRMVSAMAAAAAIEADIDPNWLAIFNAEGSAESLAIVDREAPRLAAYPKLATAIASYVGALAAPSASSGSETKPSTNIISEFATVRRFAIAHFWRLIEVASKSTDAVGTLSEFLSELRPTHVAVFNRHFGVQMTRAYCYELWGAAYLLQGGCSNDAFSDFRAALILRGKDVFEMILANPDHLAEYSDIEGDESILNLAADAYEEQTGRGLPENARPASPRSPSGQRFDFDDVSELTRRYPKLSAYAKRVAAPVVE